MYHVLFSNKIQGEIISVSMAMILEDIVNAVSTAKFERRSKTDWSHPLFLMTVVSRAIVYHASWVVI